MILSCPKCQVKYDIPKAYFAQGQRRVRCSNCSFEWEHRDPESEKRAGTESYRSGQADARDDAKVADDQDAQDREFGFYAPERANTSTRAPARPPGLIARPFVQVACVISLLIALLYSFSGPIVTAVPAFAAGYQAVGVGPVAQLKEWDICLASRSTEGIVVRFENQSALGRLIPTVSVDGRGLSASVDPLKRFVGGGTARNIQFDGAFVDENLEIGNRILPGC